ncbi:MAG: hypothetical protein OXI33_07675 [Chloroflexota bacterium]|nr:hypothetical protein [Chloroflexota bacterium]
MTEPKYWHRAGTLELDDVGIQNFEGGNKGLTLFFRETGKTLPLLAISLDQQQAAELADSIYRRLDELRSS